MIFGRAVIILALALGLGACATYYDDGVRYEDGSYYSPGDAGRGDYYYAPEPSYDRYYYDEFDRFFFDSSYYGFGSFGGGWYGSPIYSYGGYCSARYRYCPYDYGYRYIYRAPPRRERARRDPIADDDLYLRESGLQPGDAMASDDTVEAPARRRRGPLPRTVSSMNGPARLPSPEPRRSSPPPSEPGSERSSDDGTLSRKRSRNSNRDGDRN